MAEIKFDTYRVQLQQIISQKYSRGEFSGEQSVALIDGFLNDPLQTSIGTGYSLGGPSLPLVAVVGATTGKVYYFALKALIPTIQL